MAFGGRLVTLRIAAIAPSPFDVLLLTYGSDIVWKGCVIPRLGRVREARNLSKRLLSHKLQQCVHDRGRRHILYLCIYKGEHEAPRGNKPHTVSLGYVVITSYDVINSTLKWLNFLSLV